MDEETPSTSDLTAKPCPCCGATGLVWLMANLRPGKTKRIPVMATEVALAAARAGGLFHSKTMLAHFDSCRYKPWWWVVRDRQATQAAED